MNVIDVHDILTSHKFTLNNEAQLQKEIAIALDSHNISYKKEYELGNHGRIDFLLEDGVGIEIKIKGSIFNISRQLKRYDNSSEIKQLVLVTRKNIDPTPIGLKKPFMIIWLSKAWL